MDEKKLNELCPMNRVQLAEYKTIFGICCHQECAWWDDNRSCCAILSLGQSLSAIVLEMRR